VALIVVVLAPIGWGAHQPYSWDPDNIAPGSVLRAIADHYGPGWHSSYGPVPYLLTGAAYLPVLAAMRLGGEIGTPQAAYPWGFAHPERSIFALIVLARLVTALMAFGVVWLAVRDHARGAARRDAWLLPLLALGSATFVYYARTSNVDLQYLFWLWLGMHLAERPAPTLRQLAGASVAAAFAVCSKEQAAPIAVVILALAAWRASRLDAGAGRAGAVAWVGLAGAAAYALAWQLPWNLAGWRAHHDFILHVARYDRDYPATLRGFAALAAHGLAELPVVLGWLTIAGIGWAAALRVRPEGLGSRALALALYLVGFVGAVGYVYPRFLLPLVLIAFPLAARGWSAAWAAFPERRAALGVAVAGLALLGGPNLDALMLGDPRYAAGRWLDSHLPAGATVEVAGNPRFQARPPRGAAVFYTSPDSLRSDPHAPRGDVVLLSTLDQYFFRSDSVARAAWWDPLHAPPPAGRYLGPLVFRPTSNARLAAGLLVSPTIIAYLRAPDGAPDSAALHRGPSP
jgi:hypothetical protein